MVGVVKLLGILMIVGGTIYFIKPDLMKKAMGFWVKDRRLYLGGALSLLVGIVFLVAARECSMPLAVIIIGVLSILKGVLVFALGKKTVFSLVEQLQGASVKTLRILAVITLALGVLVIYAL